jgi:hypothetical protein
MEAEAALKAVREAATAADKQRHGTRAELDEIKERCGRQPRRTLLGRARDSAAAGTG